ncbi:hypothetical protein ANACOL_00929 [Anaerotruncus colihominis DSM 17241]|uniref:Uncharacterized protein n=1 Tax=Anaerotruncus colihominis DSM 17241 TaxID=445972 RepID=B0P839_9FIRM|nr:hypothetical protein ANACOL_00929 [Anaerotruncus colihominis DSM 17241]
MCRVIYTGVPPFLISADILLYTYFSRKNLILQVGSLQSKFQ